MPPPPSPPLHRRRRKQLRRRRLFHSSARANSNGERERGGCSAAVIRNRKASIPFPFPLPPPFPFPRLISRMHFTTTVSSAISKSLCANEAFRRSPCPLPPSSLSPPLRSVTNDVSFQPSTPLTWSAWRRPAVRSRVRPADNSSSAKWESAQYIGQVLKHRS